MNIKDILLIYEYNYWANKRILAVSANITQEQFDTRGSFPYGGLRGTLLHILDTEWGWRALFQSIDSATELPETDFPNIAAFGAHWSEEEAAMRAYLAGLSDENMESHLIYNTDTGIKRDRILWHCLLHVVNHGTQHRGNPALFSGKFNAESGAGPRHSLRSTVTHPAISISRYF